MTEPDLIIRVVVADDQAIVRDGLVTVLDLLPDIDVVGQASDGERAVAVVAETRPDVVLMDLRMPVLDGAAATARIVAEHPGTAVLVLTTFADDASVMGALRAGARGYLTKDASRAEVAAAVRSVSRGQTTLAGDVGARLIGGLSAGVTGSAPSVSSSAATSSAARSSAAPSAVPPSAVPSSAAPSAAGLRTRHPELTIREAEVLALVAEGKSNTEIAASLFVSVATVKTHINSLFAKLHVRDRAQAIALARS
ncbi:response regulator transcription factor [Humibacter albus]|uniref:response regulator transcription factor n=1 Tax=Humibacter albus TaxID=427754 RepID=UPI0003B36F1F|nr:response regulator transcription factor [Humibacter albus]